MKEGSSAGVKHPRVPGHEVAGIIDEVGKDVVGWKPGQSRFSKIFLMERLTFNGFIRYLAPLNTNIYIPRMLTL
jgi:NADPH:quinone reductase-like Zn-dependent oxidoreductase